MMNIVTFVTSYLKNFHYVGSISDVMLVKVPQNNELIVYREIPKRGERCMSPSMQVSLEAKNVHRRAGGKKKAKETGDDVLAKLKASNK
ncbi:unnamed protein product [Lactuca virosa]|uniref:Uncharacterized protein n=1 Tax=Lactuca virosa TaxID=75947 RepID=A0AAU9NCY1_9ASTR|nr:unnamed protein product [Lactuca virosa]